MRTQRSRNLLDAVVEEFRSMNAVLVVDDDFTTRETLRSLLRHENVTLAFACDAYDAIRRLRETRFDAVVTDVVMPGGGFMLVSSVRALQPGVPVIVLTAYDTVESRARASEKAVFEYLTKPIQPDEVIAAVRRAFRYHSTHPPMH